MSDFYNKYPYTDFHELNLDWVIERVKKLTEDWLTTQEAWKDTQEQWQQLHDYVMNYFDNLDVQEEINNKIDAMIADGSMEAIIHNQIEYIVGNNNAKLMFTVVTKVGSNTDYELAVSNDGIGFTPIADMKNFLENAPVNIGTDWQHFEDNGLHIFTITYYDNNVDGYFAMTEDFKTWKHGTFYLGFRAASGYSNPYIWTPQIFKSGSKYYMAATVQEGTPASHATFYGDGVERYSGIYCSEIAINPTVGSISVVTNPARISFPNIVDRLGNEYDVNDYMMDAWFQETATGLYCIVNDRYMLMIHSFKLSNGTDPVGNYTLCKTNIFGLRGIEAPTVLQIDSHTWKVNAGLYDHTIFDNDANITCFTHDFITFYDFNAMGCTDQFFDGGGAYIRMRNPSPFYMTKDQQYNLLVDHEIRTNTVKFPMIACRTPLNSYTAKLFTYHDTVLVPDNVFYVRDNVTIPNFSILPYFGLADAIRAYGATGEFTLTLFNTPYVLGQRSSMFIGVRANIVLTTMGQQSERQNGTAAITLNSTYSGFDITNVGIEKTGNIVRLQLNLDLDNSLTTNTDNIIGKINSNRMRPSWNNVNTYCSIGPYTSSLCMAKVIIQTNGNIDIIPYGTVSGTGNHINLTIVYPTGKAVN